MPVKSCDPATARHQTKSCRIEGEFLLKYRANGAVDVPVELGKEIRPHERDENKADDVDVGTLRSMR